MLIASSRNKVKNVCFRILIYVYICVAAARYRCAGAADLHEVNREQLARGRSYAPFSRS